jgi:hypothetical protein
VLVAAALIAMMLSPAVAASSASATSPTPARVPASFVPLRSAVKNAAGSVNVSGELDYNGGPVMPSNTDYIVFWSPGGLGAYGPGAPPEYVTGLEQYFMDLAHDDGSHQNVDSVGTQYNDLTGSVARYAVTFGGVLLDTNPYPPSQCPVNSPVIECLSDG